MLRNLSVSPVINYKGREPRGLLMATYSNIITSAKNLPISLQSLSNGQGTSWSLAITTGELMMPGSLMVFFHTPRNVILVLCSTLDYDAQLSYMLLRHDSSLDYLVSIVE